ncbi:MAG TPA: 6,7-dimethyl-8-ribityllumazine synthase [Verrucomicrobiota bacterium]|nr:6,7-dimethyl-8-ribityllumazine synthase [Verrucomicrobiota bacterium]HNU49671.1 6,7-dimethyl-8-ribityllumazine synthase [Verrucomicrobiota bacterium]
MLRKVKRLANREDGGRFVVVAARYNGRYADALLRGARRVFEEAGAAVRVVRVPGAFEIPVVAAAVARGQPAPEAVVCLGVILRGETAHAEHIGRGVTEALVRLQIESGVPMIHEVLLLENEAQAQARCLSPAHNRGAEAAQTALEMARVMRGLRC